MVEATITYKKGSTETVVANDFADLFKRLEKADSIIKLFARTIGVQEMRQGRY